MTGPSEQQNDAAGSVTAYLDVRDALIAAGASLTDQIAEGKSGGRPWARLLASHLREVLRRLDDAKGAAELWEETAMKLKDRAVQLNKRIRDDAEGAAIVADRYRAQIAETNRLNAEVERLNAELAERENDVPARITAELERDQARLIARILNRGDLNLHLEYEIRLGLGLVPDWLRSGSWDPAPGAPDLSNQPIGEIDA